VSELAQGTGLLANSIAMLGSSEENTTLARVLAQLAEVEEHCDNVFVGEADADFFILAELVREYVGLVQAVKVCSVLSFSSRLVTTVLVNVLKSQGV